MSMISKIKVSHILQRLNRRISYTLSRRKSLSIVLSFFLFISVFLLCSSAFITRIASQASVMISSITPFSSTHSYLVEETIKNHKKLSGGVSGRSLGVAEPYDLDRKKLKSCDFFDGYWVFDNDYPIYKAGSCPYVDKSFDCFKNGRFDDEFMKLKWKPRSCEIPRFDGKEMMKLLKGKRMVFVGDSLNRNMWESLICSIRVSLNDEKKIVEVSGSRSYKTLGFYSFRFKDYNSSIDFIRSPFLVKEIRNGSKFDTVRLDMIHDNAENYRNADIIVFNSGHWWTHSKTKKGKNFFQEGDHIYSSMPVAEAYLKAMRTWANWVDSNIDPIRTKVFFRGYSSSHFNGGQWNSGGNCDGETEPVINEEELAPYPEMMTRIAETVMSEMKIHVFYLNVTKMSSYRKDGHPSIFRPSAGKINGKVQDCSHWCLPGVPDSWNEILYAALLAS